MLTDTHAHLNFREFEKKLNEVITDAKINGVTKIICVSSNTKDSQKAIEIAKKYPKVVYAAVGIHPQKTCNHGNTESIEALKKLAEKPEVVAIGECGLDYAPAPPGEKERSKEEQYFLFEKQIEIAKKYNLPVIVHSRKAFDETIQILEKHFSLLNHPHGVLHCYSGGKKDIEKVVKLGFCFGLAGNLTYDVGLQNVAKEIPLEKIVLETDAPFLAPQPLRGLPNEPANVKIIADFLANLKEISPKKIARITNQNVQTIFTKTR